MFNVKKDNAILNFLRKITFQFHKKKYKVIALKFWNISNLEKEIYTIYVSKLNY